MPYPISLAIEKEEYLEPIPFHSIPLWIDRGGLFDTMVHAWSQYVVGSPNYVWEHKLKHTKYALKNWIK